MMALSRAMKNLQHDSALARRGGGNPGGGGMSGMVGRALQQGRDFRAEQAGGAGGMASRISQAAQQATGRLPGQQAGLKTKLMQAREGAGGGLRRAMERGGVMGGQYNPGPAVPRRGPMPDRGPRGPGTVAGKPRPPGGTFGFAARGGGTPALQQATAGARMQALKQRAAPRPAGAAPGGARAAMQTARAAVPAALAQPRGQTTAQRISGRQGPPARRGGMARALGSGGSRRRMLR